jgi:hypothetical protein
MPRGQVGRGNRLARMYAAAISSADGTGYAGVHGPGHRRIVVSTACHGAM